MAIEAVDEDAAVALFDPWLIVGIGGAHVGAHFENLGFAESWMQRIGRASSSIAERTLTAPFSALSIIVAPIMNSPSRRGTT